MTCLEHYFENLLFYGNDVRGDVNKENLTKDERRATEICADYVIYSLFGNREIFSEWVEKERQ